MARLTEIGLARLDSLRDYSPDPQKRGRVSNFRMRDKYLLSEVEKDSEFHIEQHSVLRSDWNKLIKKGWIEDLPFEHTMVIIGTDRPLYRD